MSENQEYWVAAGRYIDEVRRDLGILQSELSRAAGIEESHLGRILRGINGITPEKFNDLCRVLSPGISPVKLINLLGYNVPVSGEDRLPPDLVATLVQLTPAALERVTRVALGELAMADRQ